MREQKKEGGGQQEDEEKMRGGGQKGTHLDSFCRFIAKETSLGVETATAAAGGHTQTEGARKENGINNKVRRKKGKTGEKRGIRTKGGTKGQDFPGSNDGIC